VAKEFLEPGLGVNLSARDAEGRLVASWVISGREKEGKIHYQFILQKELIDFAKFDIFAINEEVIELRLRTVRIVRKDNG